MPPPQRRQRRDLRYPLNLPVSVKLGDGELRVHSENISLGGILLSSAFLIPEGSTVELAIGASHQRLLSARGKVVRAQPTISGNFAVAIAFEHLRL
jgi:c-di-GMP-binding flagellar brake protein YcgR